MRSSLLFGLLAASFVAACADVPVDDELGTESAADGEDGKGDAAAAFTYFNVSADQRACSFDTPNCGSFIASRPNRAKTQCGRGVAQRECYFGTIDWSGTAMPASVAQGYEDRLRDGETLLLRATLDPGADDRPLLVVNEVWVASSQDDVPGVYTLVADNGIRCIRAPCPSLTERKLNSTLSATITGLDFEPSGADADAIDRASSSLFGGGVIVVGYRYYDSDGGKARTANKFFTRAPVPLF